MFRLRIIPATIALAALLFIVKIMDVMRGTEALSGILVSSVEAQQPPQAPNNPPKAEAKPAESPAAAEKGKGDAKAEPKKEESKEEKKNANPNVAATPGDTVNYRYTAVEVELLQNLARRREELDHWEKNIQIKETSLDATEKRIDDKIAQIEGMKKEVAALLAQYNEKEDAKIHSLVKIYENMKPKDAARIFDEVEMPILLLVIDKMSEKKAAPIIAEMDPKKAKQVTVQLAEQRRLNSAKFNSTSTSVPIPAKPEGQP